jgi:heterodisulfide reductase subunit C
MTRSSVAQGAGAPPWCVVNETDRSCLSCNACRSECLIGAATGRLQPLRIVRMASMGLDDELMKLREIWYCLQCNHCSARCPMTVKPSEVVRRVRQQALLRGAISAQLVRAHEELGAAFVRVRWHAIARAILAQDASDVVCDWRQWAEPPISVAPSSERAALSVAGQPDAPLTLLASVLRAAELSLCMTCRECTLACPVARDRSVYDPLVIFRMAHLGLTDELLRSPSIWLCLGCETCTASCAQRVSGHMVIQALQNEAMRQGVVPQDMRERLGAIERGLYARLLDEVDALLSHAVPSGL